MEVMVSRAGMDELNLLMAWRMEVLREVFSIPAHTNSEELYQENLNYYQSALHDDSHIACFARVGNQVIGCGGICLYREMPSPDNPSGWCAYLMNIYVRKEHRGNGVAAQIVEWLTGAAMQRDITKIYLETSEDGRSLYRRMGFEPMEDYMKMDAEAATGFK